MLRIMVVDDEAPTREWFIYCIKKMPGEFEVIGSAANGKEALELIAGLKPDVVITDIRMPGMDGIELMAAVKKSYPDIDFVVLTSFAEFDYARAALKYGASEYLLKTEIRQNDVVLILQTLAQKRSKAENTRDGMRANGKKEKVEIMEKIAFGSSERHRLQEYALKLGIKEKDSFLVIALRENSYHTVGANLETVLARYPHSDLYACGKERKLFILVRMAADGKELVKESSMKALADEISKKTSQSVGVSNRYHSAHALDSAVKESLLALDYDFFTGKGSVNFFSKSSGAAPLDTNAINSLFKSFLDSLNYLRGENSLEYLDGIFKLLEAGTACDTGFARKICRSMIVLLEEKAGLLDKNIDINILEDQDYFDISGYRSHVESILVDLFKGNGRNYTASIANAVKYIENNYRQQISLSVIAKHVHLSNEYFSRLFKQETGQNFSIYLMLYRLKKAKELLDTGGLKVSEVAGRVGFQNISYFSQMYKKYMGLNAADEKNRQPNR